ncbi:MAG: hypothetical protein Q8J70_02680, partial [Thiobacillus sp.]|nr:hypothetical protein [Thiobacillus sp.]
MTHLAYRTFSSVCLAAGIAALSLPAQALSITPASTPVFTTNDTPALSAADVARLTGFNGGTLALVYKSEVDGGAEAGAAAGYYRTVYDLTPSEPSKATLGWDSPVSFIACPTCYLVVKDGKQTPAQYLFDISNWSGKESIEMTGFWPHNGAISTVSIFNLAAADGGGTVAMIPEAETYAMML